MKIHSRANAKNKKASGFQIISHFYLIVFMCRHGSEGVKSEHATINGPHFWMHLFLVKFMCLVLACQVRVTVRDSGVCKSVFLWRFSSANKLLLFLDFFTGQLGWFQINSFVATLCVWCVTSIQMGVKSHTKQFSCCAIFFVFMLCCCCCCCLGVVCFCRIIFKRLTDKISFHINTKKTFYRIPDKCTVPDMLDSRDTPGHHFHRLGSPDQTLFDIRGFLRMYSSGHVGLEGNSRADRQVGKATLTNDSRFRGS